VVVRVFDVVLDFRPCIGRHQVMTRHHLRLLLEALWLALVVGCASVPQNTVDEMLKPTNERKWKANMAVLPYARIRGDEATVYNVRNCTYISEDEYVLNYNDRSYSLNDVETLDFIVCPFKEMPSLAHTMMSFGFRDGEYLGVSVEVRLEEGETYSAAGGAARQFELMYVVADERDLIQLRTEIRNSDVYIYRCRLTKEEVRAVLIDVLKRVNTLKKRPEFYDTFANNCTTNIVAHVNHVRPGAIPWEPASLLTGYADREAYRLGLLADSGSFEETKRQARITSLAHRYAQEPLFSAMIRSEANSTRLAQAPSSRPVKRR
jgi:hypothetical protein